MRACSINLNYKFGAVVVAQLAERSLLTPEISRSNPNISKIFSIVNSKLCRKDENKRKRGREWPGFFLKLSEAFKKGEIEELRNSKFRHLDKCVYIDH